eukprot:2516884-Pleurochrysis_carterae.AAC.2
MRHRIPARSSAWARISPTETQARRRFRRRCSVRAPPQWKVPVSSLHAKDLAMSMEKGLCAMHVHCRRRARFGLHKLACTS